DEILPDLKSLYCALLGHVSDEQLNKMDDVETVRRFNLYSFNIDIIPSFEYWFPTSVQDERERELLSVMVKGGKKMTPALYSGQMDCKLYSLLEEADPDYRKDLIRLMAPELSYYLAESPIDQAAQLMETDGMMILLNRVNWEEETGESAPGNPQNAEMVDLEELLGLMTLY
ncbi:hypothetical protein N9100_02145, partial [Gammaproteobacteria bacterium]|nr:hypothetical protein [Gammaproteobacteria bacterium]